MSAARTEARSPGPRHEVLHTDGRIPAGPLRDAALAASDEGAERAARGEDDPWVGDSLRAMISAGFDARVRAQHSCSAEIDQARPPEGCHFVIGFRDKFKRAVGERYW